MASRMRAVDLSRCLDWRPAPGSQAHPVALNVSHSLRNQQPLRSPKSVSTPESGPHPTLGSDVLLPVKRSAGSDQAGATRSPARQSCPGVFYRVRAGDTLFQIAEEFGVTLQAVLDANPQLKNPNEITPGQPICVPIGAKPSVFTPLFLSPTELGKRHGVLGASALVGFDPNAFVAITAFDLPNPLVFGEGLGQPFVTYAAWLFDDAAHLTFRLNLQHMPGEPIWVGTELFQSPLNMDRITITPDIGFGSSPNGPAVISGLVPRALPT